MNMDMDTDSSRGLRRQTSITRSFNGCWTCRLRRKKCDERHPVCDTCSTLRVICHYTQDKPDWMDGGAKQEEMAARLKQEIKEKSRRRGGGERTARISSHPVSVVEVEASNGSRLAAIPDHDVVNEASLDGSTVCLQGMPNAVDYALSQKATPNNANLTQPDSILLLFYLEHLFPFLFPFYNPSLFHGGRAWILEMIIRSPVVRQATLSQSSYFFSLARGTASREGVWERVLKQSRDAFEVLRQSIQTIDSLGIRDHLHDTVHIMTSIVQVQRFEISISSFENCQAHLSAALALFRQLLDNINSTEPTSPGSSFKSVMSQLGPYPSALSTACMNIPSSEQSAFRFSSTILMLDDIILSTALQDEPKLYKYHPTLLDDGDGPGPPVTFETVIGCQNWVLLQISEIAVLDAWKQCCKRARNLSTIELVNRAKVIKDFLEHHLMLLESRAEISSNEGGTLLGVLSADHSQQVRTPASQSQRVTRVWASAALLYLSVVVSGWQPANVDVRYHINCIIELLVRQISSPLLRTMVWPFCVAGCLAEPAQQPLFRGMVEELQPPSVFGTVRKALEIMESVWCHGDADDSENRDLAMCFRSQGDLVLLV